MMELKSVFILTITIAFAVADILVTIPNGTLRGRKEYSSRGISFYAFQQIPFAKPPVGELRFREPQPADNWEGILDATYNDKSCFQFVYYLENVTNYENEDCLYLNVYTPKYPSVDLALSVMFEIYGGSFTNGAANFDYVGPHYLMEHGEVIVVTANYRAGPLGFISTGDTVIPGNYGLKDLQMVLKWIQENIKYFGGDPKKVTISASSSGAAAAGYLMMGKGSEDLFRAAILQSGSNIEPLAYQRSHRSVAFKLGAALGRTFKDTESKALLQFLRTIPARKLNKIASQITLDDVYLDQYMDGFIFSPVIEPEHETALITERSYGVLESGRMARIPLLIGTVSEEMLIKPEEDTFSSELASMDNDTSLLVSRNMHITDKDKLRKIGNIIRSWYTNGTLHDDMGAGVRFLSEASFTRSLIRHAQLQSRFSDVYFYEFSYSGKLGHNNGPFIPGIGKVRHAEDIRYLFAFYNNSGLNDYPKEDILTSDRYRALVTNFIVHLNPTPEPSSLLQNISWPKVTPDNFQYLSINETLSIRKNYREDTYRKWLRLYEAFAVKPYDTF